MASIWWAVAAARIVLRSATEQKTLPALSRTFQSPVKRYAKRTISFKRVYDITSEYKSSLSGNIIPGQRGKCGDLPCPSILSANRDDIAIKQFQKQFLKKYLKRLNTKRVGGKTKRVPERTSVCNLGGSNLVWGFKPPKAIVTYFLI